MFLNIHNLVLNQLFSDLELVACMHRQDVALGTMQ